MVPKDTCVVYIVDDDDLVRRALERLVRAGGFRPKPCATPDALLTEVGSECPACILLDMTMPRMSGLQVQAQLKARGITIPVIAVSARDDEDTRRSARALDARFFFANPLTIRFCSTRSHGSHSRSGTRMLRRATREMNRISLPEPDTKRGAAHGRH